MSIVTPDLLSRYDVPGPRYTSYPTADRFIEAFGADDYALALQQRGVSAVSKAQPLSVYVHVPFCESLCYYCACNKIITRHPERAQDYLKYLAKEVALHTAHSGQGQQVSQLHLGGGSPTFLDNAGLQELMDLLGHHFNLKAGGEFSIEVDPRTVDSERLAFLRSLGFNRLSFGVQDFDLEVQKAVHREQSTEQVFDLVEVARQLGFESINVDLIYGLPKQTAQSFARTLQQVCELKPDRIALYAYAHLPERFKPQRRIDVADLPQAGDKLHMLASALDHFSEAGYVYVGMDHFALPQDALAVAKRQGRLHRNFQGYSTQPDCDLIALGVSAIGRIGATYSQNAKTLDEYYGFIDQGRLPIVRGLTLTRDDTIRRAAIMSIMCQGELLFESMDAAWLVDSHSYFAAEWALLEDFQSQGMLHLHDEGMTVTALGWYFIRGIAMVFDRYLRAGRERARFSRII